MLFRSMRQYLDDTRLVAEETKYSFVRKGTQSTFSAIWFWIVSMHFDQEIFGRDGGQKQDLSGWTDAVIDKHLAQASEDDRNFLKSAKKELYLTDVEAHRDIQRDWLAGVRAAIANNTLCKSFVENKLRNVSSHDLYIGVRAFMYVKEWIC